VKLVRFKKIFFSALFFSLPLNSTAIFAEEFFKEDPKSVLIAETREKYREHEDESEDEDDVHSKDHDWKNHYHTIRSIRLKSNGNLKIRFCERVELLEGQVYADDVRYDVKDAYKIRKRSIIWRINKKGTFKKGNKIFVDTKDFLGRPIEKEPNPNEIRSLVRGCGLPILYLPPGVEVTEGSNGIAILGLVVAIGAAAAGGGGSSGGSGSTSSN
tara:strand:+ start:57 stop:698 length:642 start_codon:yes stop_codon:yes gene_type:complete